MSLEKVSHYLLPIAPGPGTLAVGAPRAAGCWNMALTVGRIKTSIVKTLSAVPNGKNAQPQRRHDDAERVSPARREKPTHYED